MSCYAFQNKHHYTVLYSYCKQIWVWSFLPLSSLPADEIRIISSFAQQFHMCPSL